jgi:hypothetical protein
MRLFCAAADGPLTLLRLPPRTMPAPQPIMLGDAALASRFAARMLQKGIYVVSG